MNSEHSRCCLAFCSPSLVPQSLDHRKALLEAGIPAQAKQLLNGSYTTSKASPNDIDIAVEVPISESVVIPTLDQDNAILKLPLETDAPTVLAEPPYVELGKMAQISAILPAANLFHRGLVRFGVREFPALALEKLEQISRSQRLAYVTLFALCCLLYLRYPAQQGRRRRRSWSPGDAAAGPRRPPRARCRGRRRS